MKDEFKDENKDKRREDNDYSNIFGTEHKG